MEARKTHRDSEALSGVKAQPGDRFMSFLVTAAADPQPVVFSELGLPDMEETGYVVIVHDEGLGLAVDESTKATTGFNILNGTGAEVANVLVIGDVAE